MFIFTYGVANVSAVSGDTIYVSGSSGNDSWNGYSSVHQSGTISGPKLSIKNATGTVNTGGTINIANGRYTGAKNTNINIDKNMNIVGQSKYSTIINGTGINWIFKIKNGVNITIKNIRITNAKSSFGGAINNYGTLTVTNSIFTGNTANWGGSIYNYGTLNVKNSTFSGNSTGWGGAICNFGDLAVTSNIFHYNHANYGGAIYNYGTLTVTNSIFTGNTANWGGSIYNYGTLNVKNSTFTSNSAKWGNEIYNTGTANIHFNRIVEKSANQSSAVYNSGTADAALNWWGDNKGPNGKISGLTVTRWLVLSVIATPTSIKNKGYSKITANLKHDNKGTIHTEGCVPDGILINFATTLGTIIKQSTTVNGIAQSIFKSGSSGTVKVSAKLDNQTSNASVKIIDTIHPKVISRYPKNVIGFSKTRSISIKFSEGVKKGINYSKIYIKNLTTGKIVSINKRISGNTLYIKTTSKRLAYKWYQVIIPIGAIKDYAGNNLLSIYKFKFKTEP